VHKFQVFIAQFTAVPVLFFLLLKHAAGKRQIANHLNINKSKQYDIKPDIARKHI